MAGRDVWLDGDWRSLAEGIAFFLLFSPETLEPTTPVFWLMMQIGMAFGFLTSYPVNWWLLSKKIKEVM